MTSLFARGLAAAVLSLPTLAAFAAENDSDRAIAGVMTEFVKPGEPGCTVGVAQGGALTHALAFGLADLEKGIAVLERMLVLDPANARVDGELKLLLRRAEGLN